MKKTILIVIMAFLVSFKAYGMESNEEKGDELPAALRACSIFFYKTSKDNRTGVWWGWGGELVKIYTVSPLLSKNAEGGITAIAVIPVKIANKIQ